MLNQQKRKMNSVEPFLKGEDAEIKTKEQAIKVARTNVKYMFFVSIIILALQLNTIYHNEIGYDYLIVSLIYGSMSTLIYFFMSRTAAVLMMVLTIAILALLFYGGVYGSLLITLALIALVLSRCIKATFYFHKQTEKSV